MYIKEFIKTKVDMDFEIGIVDVYVYKIFKVYLTLKDKEEENLNAKDGQQKRVRDSLIEEVTKEMPQKLFTKNFKISKDFKSLLINEKTYEIPDFFNKNTIKSKDLKTWEMIFICIFDDEINKKVKILLKEPSPILVEKLKKLKSSADNEEK